MLIFRKTYNVDGIAQDVKNAVSVKLVDYLARQISEEVNCEKVAYHSANTVESAIDKAEVLRYNPPHNETGRI